jgi:hypothetical protein
VDNCELCKHGGGAYDFKNVCCLVRFLLGIPKREIRAGWLKLWRKKYGDKIADEVQEKFLKQWSERK